MKRFAAVLLVVACGGSQESAPPPKTEPIPSVASVTAPTASATPVVVDASAPPPAPQFKVVKETVHATTQMIARLGEREPQTKLTPIEPKVGPVAQPAADAACYVATGLSIDVDATCVVKIDAVSGATLTATVDADFEDDSMQSRSRTHVTMHGTLTVDPATHAILRASFTGQERFTFRPPCEKIGGCERCDPLVKKPGCKPDCFCPFKNVGTADVETSYGP